MDMRLQKLIEKIKSLEGKTIEEIIPVEEDGELKGIILQTTEGKIVEFRISGDAEGFAEIIIEVTE